ncbi:MAG: ABC transporter permease [Clostridia bacterium]
MLEILLSPAVLINYFYSILRMSTPLVYGSMGAVISKRAGTNNLAIEATMLLSAMAGCMTSIFVKNLWFSLLVAILTGVLVSLFLAIMFLKYRADSRMVCISLNTVATGLAMFVPLVVLGAKGNTSASPSLTFPTWSIPFIKDIPVVGQILSGQCCLTYIAILVVIAVWFLLFKTPLGLRIRAAGETPEAAESVGVNVYRVKLLSFVLTGVVSSIGGCFMSMYYLSWFTYGMIAGRGFICLSVSNLTNGRPIMAALVAILFGAIDALANNLQGVASIPADLLQTLPYLVTVIGVTMVGYLDVKRLKAEK